MSSDMEENRPVENREQANEQDAAHASGPEQDPAPAGEEQPEMDPQTESPGRGEGEEALDPVTVMENEVSKWKNLALRSQADLENFRKRMAREKSDAIRYGNAALLEGLLPILDNFTFGLEAARQKAEDSVVVEGMSMVHKQLNDLLEEFGVKEVPAEGEPFDPNVHEAVKEEASEEVPEGHVLAVTRRGYRLHDRLLRAANVIVSRGNSPPTGSEDAGSTSGSTGDTGDESDPNAVEVKSSRES